MSGATMPARTADLRVSATGQGAAKVPARLKVAVTRRLPDATETRLAELFDARLRDDDRPLSAGALLEAAARADVLVPTVTDRITADVIAAGAAGRLKLIANFGVGVDHIDLAAARAHNIPVTNTPGVLTEDTADVAMALILMAARRLGEGERLLRAGGWDGWAPTMMLGRRLRGARLGIVGMGRIGAALALRARAFGLGIHYWGRRRTEPGLEAALEATWWDSLDAMLPRVDIVSINCPLTPATHRLLNERRLGLLRPGSILINTARGEIVEADALARALQAGTLGAGFDVYENEPRVDPRLMGLPNVVLLPHLGSATLEGRVAMGERVLINIKTFADGHRAPDRVVAT